jgi:rhodanese-related sulfurtransferase
MGFIKNNIGLIGLAIGSAGMLLLPWLRGRSRNIAELSPNMAVLLINRQSPLILDVRDEKEFAEGHLPEAKNIPLAALDKRLAEIETWKDKPVLVNCKSGARSETACNLLHRQGFTKLNSLAGGIAAWQTAKLPVSKD